MVVTVDVVVGMAIALAGLFETLRWIYLVSMYAKKGEFAVGCWLKHLKGVWPINQVPKAEYRKIKRAHSAAPGALGTSTPRVSGIKASQVPGANFFPKNRVN